MFNGESALKFPEGRIFIFIPLVGLIAIWANIDVALLTAHGLFSESVADVADNHLVQSSPTLLQRMSLSVLHHFFVYTTTYANFEVFTPLTDTPKDRLSSLSATKCAVKFLEELHQNVIVGALDLILRVALPAQIIVTSACAADPVVLLPILSANIAELGLMITVVLGLGSVLVFNWFLLIEDFWSGLQSVRLVIWFIGLPLAVMNVFTARPLLILNAAVANIIIALVTT